MTTQEMKNSIDLINSNIISEKDKFDGYDWETLIRRHDRFSNKFEYLFGLTVRNYPEAASELKKLNLLLMEHPGLAIPELATRYVLGEKEDNIVGALALIFFENNLQLENAIILTELYKILEQGGYGYQPDDVLKLIEVIAVKNNKAFIESIVDFDGKNQIKTKNTDWILQTAIGIYSFKVFDPIKNKSADENILGILSSILDRKLDQTIYTFAIQLSARLGDSKKVFDVVAADILKGGSSFDIWYLCIFLNDNFDKTLALYDELLFNHKRYSTIVLLKSLTAFWFDDNTKNGKIADLIYKHLKRDVFHHNKDTTYTITQHMERCIQNPQGSSIEKYTELVKSNLIVWNKYSDCLVIMYSWSDDDLYQSLAASLKFWYIGAMDPSLKISFVKDFIESVNLEKARVFLIDFFLDFDSPLNEILLKHAIEKTLVSSNQLDKYRIKLSQLQALQ